MNIKKSAAVIMTVAMLCGASAYPSKYDIFFNKSIIDVQATDKTADDAISWVKSQIGKSIDYDGAYGAQCVDLILAYYNYLGVPTSSGNGKDYATNTLPSGWTRIAGAVPQKGDILVYGASDSNPYGHVAIYESERSTYHQNFNNVQKVVNVTNISYKGFSNPYWGVIRPNWSTKMVGKKMTAGAGQTIPDGDYWISCTAFPGFYVDPAPGNSIPAEKSASVATWNYGDSKPPVSDVWTVKYLNNGFYQITQKGTEMSLDVYGAEMYSETDIIMYPLWGEDNAAQQWSIKASGKGYSIQSKCNSFFVDAKGGEAVASNIWVYQGNGSAAQIFSFIPYTEPAVTTTTTTTTTTKASTTTTTTTAVTTTTTTTSNELAVEKSEVSLAVGGQFTIKANQSGLTYESSDKDIVTVSKSGVITAKKAGSAVIFITNANEDTVVVKVTVGSGAAETTTKESVKASYGDANCDGKTSVADAVAILQYIGNRDKYKLTESGLKNADVDGIAGVTGKDALVIQQVDAGLYKLEDLPLKAK